MSTGLARFIQSIPVIDVHEHHMPEESPGRQIGLLQLLEESYVGWTQKRPYPLPLEPPVTLGSPSNSRGTWADIAAYAEGSGTNAAVRNMVCALCELYEVRGGGINERNWEGLDAEIRRRNTDPAWSATVMDRAGIQTAISDPYRDPLLDVRKALGDRYRSVLRINAFAFGWHPDSRDHNGHNGRAMMSRLGLAPASFDEYLEALPKVLDCLPGLQKVGLKNALAYDRSVDFDMLDEVAARDAWGKSTPSEHERKAFGDCVVDRLCRLAGERDIPFQMHLGSALIRGSRPLNAAGLIERHPRTRFLLMHLAYPWTGELLGMAFVYRNIWIDLTWSWLLSPTRFLQAFREAVDILPDESRMMLGGDTWHTEEAYGAIGGARNLIAESLDSMVRAGNFRRRDAERLAVKIFHGNAQRFFGLG
ncbi:MAG: amidohydrolase family protein [Spirochaetes bacterium]|nr:amidohydrolase family protein [Spirochaetota bacterium]